MFAVSTNTKVIMEMALLRRPEIGLHKATCLGAVPVRSLSLQEPEWTSTVSALANLSAQTCIQHPAQHDDHGGDDNGDVLPRHRLGSPVKL